MMVCYLTSIVIFYYRFPAVAFYFHCVLVINVTLLFRDNDDDNVNGVEDAVSGGCIDGGVGNGSGIFSYRS
jgi:hypothetical protein